MNSKALITIVAFAVWLVISWRWYTCGIKGFCGDGSSSPTRSIASPQETGNSSPRTVIPLLFAWSEALPTAQQPVATLADSLRSEIEDNQLLKITGQYFPEEENATDYPDLGLARAYATKALLAAAMDTSQMVISSQEVAPRSGVRDNPFGSVHFTAVPAIPDGDLVERDGGQE